MRTWSLYGGPGRRTGAFKVSRSGDFVLGNFFACLLYVSRLGGNGGFGWAFTTFRSIGFLFPPVLAIAFIPFLKVCLMLFLPDLMVLLMFSWILPKSKISSLGNCGKGLKSIRNYTQNLSNKKEQNAYQEMCIKLSF